MSLFLAITPPPPALEDLEDAIHRLRRPLATMDLHWQPAKRWHVTMAFLGEQDDEADEVVAARADSVASTVAPPVLRLSGASTFGRQVLWVGVHGATDNDEQAFAHLAHTVQAGLRADGFTLERRPWHPHLTVARTRGTDARPAVAHLNDYTGPSWAVTELLVVRSEGGPHPRHTVIHRTPFTAA